MEGMERVDVIDLIINVLREHEKTLDNLIGRLEKLVEGVEGKQTGKQGDLIIQGLSELELDCTQCPLFLLLKEMWGPKK